jgi:hypothetical protein
MVWLSWWWIQSYVTRQVEMLQIIKLIQEEMSLPSPPTPLLPGRNYFALISNFVEERE